MSKAIEYTEEWCDDVFELLPRVRAIAVDKDGAVCVYRFPPSINENEEEWGDGSTYTFHVGYTDTTGWGEDQWKHTLTETRECFIQRFPYDDPVLVRNSKDSAWVVQYSAGRESGDKDGLLCWVSGCTSLTAPQTGTDTESWKYVREYDPDLVGKVTGGDE